MKVVALHTDFRIYWPARWAALREVLQRRGHTLDVVEIAGKGSNYSFAGGGDGSLPYWHVLFPDQTPEQLSGDDVGRALHGLLSGLDPDVIMAGAIAFPSGALAVSWCLQRGRKVIVFDDAKVEAVSRSGAVTYVKRCVYSGVDAVFYPSDDWRATGRYWGFSDEQMFFGVDVVDNAFWQMPRPAGLPEHPYFVAVGRQIPKKNFLPLVRAFHRYQHQAGDEACHLTLVGDGPEHQSIVDYIKTSRLEDYVHCLPFLSQDELAAVYQQARALCLCSDSRETWGLVVNEAMASGCPVIASVECGATSTLVHDGVNGYAFSIRRFQDLTACMDRMHRLDDASLQSMKTASRQIISQWGLDRFCQGAVEAIDYVSSHPKRKPRGLPRVIIRLWKGRYRPV